MRQGKTGKVRCSLASPTCLPFCDVVKLLRRCSAASKKRHCRIRPARRQSRDTTLNSGAVGPVPEMRQRKSEANGEHTACSRLQSQERQAL